MALARHSFDVVVLDVRLPGIDGFEVFRQIKTLMPRLPVILLVDHGNIDQALEASRKGVTDYIAKPYEIETIARAAHEAVKSAGNDLPSTTLAEDEVPIHLILIGNELDLHDSLTSSLREQGFFVTAATSGDEAMQLMERQVFEVALIDAKSPGMEGWALLRRLSWLDPLIEILVLTKQPSMGLTIDGFNFLTVPQSPVALAEKVRKGCRNRRHRIGESDRNRAVFAVTSWNPV